MDIRNFLDVTLDEVDKCHGGVGVVRQVMLMREFDFQTHIRFFNYTVLPPHTSIGIHKHGDDEELYIILEGCGIMNVDGDSKKVKPGDLIVNQPFGSHGLENPFEEELKILVFEVYK